MKKAMRSLLAIAAAGVLLTGCGAGKNAFHPAVSCVYVAKDGTVSSALVKEYGEQTLDENDLKQYLEAAVIRFNKENGGAESAQNQADSGTKLPAALTSVSAKNGVMTAVFDYATVADLVKFRDTDDNQDQSNTVTAVEVKSLADADGAGWLAGNLVKPDGTAAPAEEVKKESAASVALIEGGGAVMFSGKVLYMTEGAVKQDEYTVNLPDGGKTYVVFK